MNGRREFLLVLAASPIALASAQPAKPAGKVMRVGMLTISPPQSPRGPFRKLFMDTLRELGWVEGVNVAHADNDQANLPEAAAALVARRPDTKYRLPLIAYRSEQAEEGALLSYNSSLADHTRAAARIVDKVLKGTRPADIPVEHPTKFELVLNMKTARALGLVVPQSLLLQADRVIE